MSAFKLGMKYLLAVFFIGAGINHFVHPDFYLRIMPPYLPWPAFLQYLAGFFEIALGVLLLFPQYTRRAAWGLVGLLIAVYPANIHMAINHQLYPEVSLTFHWIRLPLQFIFIAWAWWFTREDETFATGTNSK
jgi:uncharacterized membrane protein